MPPNKSVKCLQSLALEQVSKYLILISPAMKKHPNRFREYFIKNVHAWARTEILDYTKHLLLDTGGKSRVAWDFLDNDLKLFKSLKGVLTDNLSLWLTILNTMLDIGVSRLPPICFHSCFETELHTFFTILNNSNVHPKVLNVNFQMSSKNDYTAAVYTPMYTHQLTLDEGLASKLVSLKLIAVCDNSILKAIGEHALCLKYLDLSGSWKVDEIGLQNLLFKNGMDTNSTSNDKLCQQLSQLYDNKSLLNQCCFTLEKLRIQNTNTGDTGHLMILACVKSLKTLGGFLNFRNIGDYLVSIWKNSPKPRVFQLTELFDMQLTNNKIPILKECMPHLNKLNTRFSCVYKPQDFIDLKQQDSMFWSRVKMLTIDLDYMLNQYFFNFLNNYGNNLLELNILDQETGIDVGILLTSCPNLLVLKGSFNIYNMPVGQFTKLKAIELRNSTLDAIEWFFENCPCLEVARLLGSPRDLNWNSQIFQKPSWVMCNNLKRLEFCLSNPANTEIEYLNILGFIDKCLKLQHLGWIDGWCHPLLITDVRKYVNSMNYDINLY